MTTTDLAPLLGARVRAAIRFPDSCREVRSDYILRFLPPNGTAVLAHVDTGREETFPLEALQSVTDARRACAACGGLVNNVFDPREYHSDYVGPTPLCADDYRTVAYQQPPPITPCPECSSGDQAFYSPGDKTFACAQCHMRRGGMTGSTVEFDAVKVQAAACRSGDIDDPRHDWKHVRGHRWHCRSCHAKRFTDPPEERA